MQPSVKIVSKPSSSATGPSAGRVAAGDDAGEEVDLAFELHAPELFDVGVGAGRLVGGDGLDLALAEEPALGIDLFGREDVALVRRLAEHGGGAGEECHVPGLVGRIRNLALGRLGRRLEHRRSGHQPGARKPGPADRHAERAEEIATIDLCRLVHGHSPFAGSIRALEFWAWQKHWHRNDYGSLRWGPCCLTTECFTAKSAPRRCLFPGRGLKLS